TGVGGGIGGVIRADELVNRAVLVDHVVATGLSPGLAHEVGGEPGDVGPGGEVVDDADRRGTAQVVVRRRIRPGVDDLDRVMVEGARRATELPRRWHGGRGRLDAEESADG